MKELLLLDDTLIQVNKYKCFKENCDIIPNYFEINEENPQFYVELTFEGMYIYSTNVKGVKKDFPVSLKKINEISIYSYEKLFDILDKIPSGVFVFTSADKADITIKDDVSTYYFKIQKPEKKNKKWYEFWKS